MKETKTDHRSEEVVAHGRRSEEVAAHRKRKCMSRVTHNIYFTSIWAGPLLLFFVLRNVSFFRFCLCVY